MWQYYNPNPVNDKSVGDCAIRAIAKALDTDWESAYTKLSLNGFAMGDLPNANNVWGALLRQNEFYRSSLPDTCPDCYTAEEFAKDHPKGTFVLGFGNHVATIVDGTLYDSWNSSNEIPQFFWYKKEDK